MEKTFELKKLKIESFGLVDCKYIETETTDDGVTVSNEFHVKVSRTIHSDLRNLFIKDLCEIIGNIIGTDDLTEIEATGIAFAGKNDNVGITIFGERETAFGRIVFKTPRIRYKTSESKLASQLTVFADKIISEVYAYIFENKCAEMEVFGEN